MAGQRGSITNDLVVSRFRIGRTDRGRVPLSNRGGEKQIHIAHVTKLGLLNLSVGHLVI
jgi:hypothetical protein